MNLTSTSNFTATTYADHWIRENLEPASTRTRLSGKDGIYDTYLLGCEKENKPPSRIMVSKKRKVVMALEHRTLLTKVRGRERLIFEGIRVKEREETKNKEETST